MPLLTKPYMVKIPYSTFGLEGHGFSFVAFLSTDAAGENKIKQSDPASFYASKGRDLISPSVPMDLSFIAPGSYYVGVIQYIDNQPVQTKMTGTVQVESPYTYIIGPITWDKPIYYPGYNAMTGLNQARASFTMRTNHYSDYYGPDPYSVSFWYLVTLSQNNTLFAVGGSSFYTLSYWEVDGWVETQLMAACGLSNMWANAPDGTPLWLPPGQYDVRTYMGFGNFTAANYLKNEGANQDNYLEWYRRDSDAITGYFFKRDEAPITVGGVAVVPTWNAVTVNMMYSASSLSQLNSYHSQASAAYQSGLITYSEYMALYNAYKTRYYQIA